MNFSIWVAQIRPRKSVTVNESRALNRAVYAGAEYCALDRLWRATPTNHNNQHSHNNQHNHTALSNLFAFLGNAIERNLIEGPLVIYNDVWQ